MYVFEIIQYQFTSVLNHSTHKLVFLVSCINIMHQYSEIKSKHKSKIAEKHVGVKVDNTLK